MDPVRLIIRAREFVPIPQAMLGLAIRELVMCDLAMCGRNMRGLIMSLLKEATT